MMYHYLALLWDDSNSSATESCSFLVRRLLQQSGWVDVARSEGLWILSAGGRPEIHKSQFLRVTRGAVLGTAFDRRQADGSPCATCDDLDQWAHEYGVRGLVARFWGDFIAILPEANSSAVQFYRPPMGILPCYLYQHQAIQVVFSDLADLHHLGIFPNFNWQYIGARLRLPHGLSTAHTALDGVEEVRAGEFLTVQGGRKHRTFVWNPFHIAAENVVNDPHEATATLHALTKRCTNAWTTHHSGLVHLLSGGVDSSIILACLRNTPHRPRITCVNYYSQGSTSDERAYAHLVAKHCGYPLVEHARKTALNLEPAMSIRARSPRPSFYVGYVENSRLEATLAERYQATAIVTGGGGDQLFYQCGMGLTVGDFMHQHGVSPSVFRIAYEAAKLEKKTIWEMLRKGALDAMYARRWHPRDELSGDREFLTERTFMEHSIDDLYVHPWFASAAHTPSGKRFHIYNLVVPQLFFYDPLYAEGDPEHISPLFSLPLVEHCLRIPTYVLTKEGWDRSIARFAFEHELPSDIVWRRSKGGMEEHMKGMLVNNLPLIRAVLLEGMLVQRGLIDRERVESFLALRPTTSPGGMAAIFEYFSLEAWLHSAIPIAKAAAA